MPKLVELVRHWFHYKVSKWTACCDSFRSKLLWKSDEDRGVKKPTAEQQVWSRKLFFLWYGRGQGQRKPQSPLAPSPPSSCLHCSVFWKASYLCRFTLEQEDSETKWTYQIRLLSAIRSAEITAMTGQRPWCSHVKRYLKIYCWER